MSDEFLHGVKVTEISEALRTLTTSSTAVIGLVATAPDADAAAFPLNKPTLLTGITPSVIAKAGKKRHIIACAGRHFRYCELQGCRDSCGRKRR